MRRWLSTYFSLRMLGIHALAVLLIAAMTLAGFWQLGVYSDRRAVSAAEAALAPPSPLHDLLGPDEAFTGEADRRRVWVSGRYVGPQLLVARPTGDPWLVTPLQTETGSAILVVRGRAFGETLTEAPPGHVEVSGTLLPSEARATDPDPEDVQTPALNTAQLVGRFDTDLYSGYIVLSRQQPASDLEPAKAPPPNASATAGLRNLMYALQWWVFGAFVVFFWWRLMRERVQVA